MNNSIILPQTTQDLRKQLQIIVDGLQKGIIAVSTARAQIAGIQAQLNSLRLEMNAVTLGRPFEAVSLDEDIRNRPAVN